MDAVLRCRVSSQNIGHLELEVVPNYLKMQRGLIHLRGDIYQLIRNIDKLII